MAVFFLVIPVIVSSPSSYRKRTLEEYEQDTMSSRLSLSQRVQTYLYYPPHKRFLRWFGLDRLAGDAMRKPLSGHNGPISDIPMVVIPSKETTI
jgi:hypothetical protein